MPKANTKIAVPVQEPDWAKALREKAKQARAVETLGMPRVTHASSVLMIDGQKVKDNKLLVIPIGIAYAKTYFKGKYVQGASDTPGCYAFGAESDKGLHPHPQAPDKQAPDCDTCEHNKFGTAELGRGKRCSDKRRVAFILAADLAKDGEAEVAKAVAKALIYQIEVPPGSLRGFGTFLKSLEDATVYGSIQEAVVQISTENVAGKAYTVNFEFMDRVPAQAMPYLLKRAEGVYEQLSQPFPVIEQEDKAPAKPVKGQRR